MNIMANDEYTKGNPVVIRADIFDTLAPQEVSLFYRSVRYRRWYRTVPMKNTFGYIYEAVIPADKISTGIYEFCIAVKRDNKNADLSGRR